jgi:Ca-activated chloride channel family protein
VQVTTSRWLRRSGAFIEYRARLSRADAGVVMTIRDARGIRSLESPTHDLKIDEGADGAWNVAVLKAKTGLSALPDDLVIRYQPAEPPLVLRAALHHDAGEESFLSMTFSTPPAQKTPAQETVVRGGSDVTLVLDRSGSMEGASIESARNAAKAIVERLLPTDRANVIAFDNEVDALYRAPRALTDNVRRELLEYIGRIQAGGGTDIAKALSRALGSQIHDDHPDIVLFLTDGQSDGPAAVKVATEDASNARVFTVGIGTGVDKALLSRLASIKHGRFTFIADPRAVAAEFPKVLSQLEDPVLTDVTLRAEGGAIERVYPQALGDLFPADELRVFGRSDSRQPFKIVLEGNERGAKRRFETTVDPTKLESEPWVARSWARARVDDLLEETSAKGETEELKNEAIELGLAYGLVTPYTSFLAIPETELTEAAKSAVGSMRERRRHILTARTDAAALSRMNMPPGDPVLRVNAPRDATRVTAMFPFGLSQDLSYDEMSECWMTRFLVPVDVPDGTYEVRVVIALADGSVKVALAHYTIDSHEPSLDVEAKAVNGGVVIRVMADEPALEVRVAVVGDLRNTRSLAPQSDRRTFEGHLVLPPGRYRLRIVVADLARNETEREVDVVVPSHEAEPQ